MKYTIFEFNQEKAVEYNLDIEDLLLLQWITDFTTRIPAKIINEEKYYWIKYEELLKDLPILRFSSKDRLYRKLNELVQKGILIHQTVRVGGTYSYYGFGENYSKLLSEERRREEQQKDARRCLQKGIVRADWKREIDDLEIRINHARYASEKNYWICMKRMREMDDEE